MARALGIGAGPEEAEHAVSLNAPVAGRGHDGQDGRGPALRRRFADGFAAGVTDGRTFREHECDADRRPVARAVVIRSM